MGCDIKRLARALNAECTYVELERQYPRDLKEIIRLFFERWLKTERDCAPIGQLMRGLKEAELSDTYNKMETYMKEGNEVVQTGVGVYCHDIHIPKNT